MHVLDKVLHNCKKNEVDLYALIRNVVKSIINVKNYKQENMITFILKYMNRKTYGHLFVCAYKWPRIIHTCKKLLRASTFGKMLHILYIFLKCLNIMYWIYLLIKNFTEMQNHKTLVCKNRYLLKC